METTKIQCGHGNARKYQTSKRANKGNQAKRTISIVFMCSTNGVRIHTECSVTLHISASDKAASAQHHDEMAMTKKCVVFGITPGFLEKPEGWPNLAAATMRWCFKRPRLPQLIAALLLLWLPSSHATAPCWFLGDCNGHGDCNTATATCSCYTGWGAATDIATYKAPDCSLRTCIITVHALIPRVGDLSAGMMACGLNGTCPPKALLCGFAGTCPSGPAWVDVPSAAYVAHANAECSARGLCDRTLGQCRCFIGFEGDACQRCAS